jgi:hypothetical protein
MNRMYEVTNIKFDRSQPTSGEQIAALGDAHLAKLEEVRPDPPPGLPLSLLYSLLLERVAKFYSRSFSKKSSEDISTCLTSILPPLHPLMILAGAPYLPCLEITLKLP